MRRFVATVASKAAPVTPASAAACECSGTVKRHSIHAVVGSTTPHAQWPHSLSDAPYERATMLNAALKKSASTMVNAVEADAQSQWFIAPGDVLILPFGVKFPQASNTTLQQASNVDRDDCMDIRIDFVCLTMLTVARLCLSHRS